MDLPAVTSDLGLHVRDAVLITEAEPIDAPGPRIVWANPAFTDMTGYTLEEVIGRTPRLLQGPDTDLAALKRIRVALEAWQPVREVLKNYTKEGKPFFVELAIKPIADETGWFRYWVSVQRDVTAWVEQEEEFRRAREEAESANRMKSEFLANMSHEIRTPLNGVLGMAQLLQLMDLDEEQQGAVSTIISSGQSLLGLIDDILDITKAEAGRIELEPKPTTARSLVDQAAEAVRGVALTKGLRIRTEAGQDADTPFLVDPRRLRQVLINVAGNATKFTEEGEVVLASDADGAHMVFEVRDTGPGVPPSEREAIFDRFRQVDGSATRRHDGAGLGLAIAKGIVTAAGGTIAVTDAPEGGACFRIVLPFQRTESHESSPSEKGAQAASVQERRALVVDDNEVNRMVVKGALGLQGWTVVSADCGKDGLQAWRDNSFDLVIVDRRMPDMGGLEVIRAIRSDEAAGGDAGPVPILMLTADAVVDTENMAREAGADAFLSKPFSLDQLFDVVDTLVHERG